MTTTPVPESLPSEARKTFQEHLDELRVDVIRLAALTTEAIAGGTQALLDDKLVQRVAGLERLAPGSILEASRPDDSRHQQLEVLSSRPQAQPQVRRQVWWKCVPPAA